ncbi:Uncharacterized conserved protein [Flavobacterium anhuiense]|uniref:Uncharacterized conserved protein n=1 Tax=Flavobacterium anhuiense TaxID=459526 RepID=A0ABY0M3B5_9FLAO|nr:DUF1254 domain-containing protein [Flavobacterium anhuiense]SCY96205.1 Uncharacterized conserved protein [Flavobacterium anhuiense]
MKKDILSIFLLICFITACKKEDKDTVVNQNEKTSQTSFQSENIKEKILYNRAVEAAIWGLPAVNFQLMYKGMEKLNGSYNQIVYWPGLLSWKNQTLTPNPDVIYLMPFFNTEKGPVVLEIPPADSGVFNGSVMNYWQAAIEDVGPGGMDKGKGGKYIILPPGYDKSKVPAGYFVMQSDTYRGYALLRSVLKSGSSADVKSAVDYGRRVKLYPYSEASNSPQTKFVDASKAEFNSVIQYDNSFYQALNEIVQEEPFLERDRAMIDALRTIGIERGKPFSPDAKTKEIFNAAAKDAKEYLLSIYENTKPFYEGTNWFFPASDEYKMSVMTGYQKSEIYPIDNRAVCYMMAFFSAKHIGESQYYLLALKDKDGNFLRGSSSYKVIVPANVPVKQYWSITVYNRETHTFIRNSKWAARSSQTPGIKKNTDGTVTLYFGPKPPPEGESNWVPTDPNGDFELLARFYGPTKTLYDQSWKLNDVEKVN